MSSPEALPHEMRPHASCVRSMSGAICRSRVVGSCVALCLAAQEEDSAAAVVGSPASMLEKCRSHRSTVSAAVAATVPSSSCSIVSGLRTADRFFDGPRSVAREL